MMVGTRWEGWEGIIVVISWYSDDESQSQWWAGGS